MHLANLFFNIYQEIVCLSYKSVSSAQKREVTADFQAGDILGDKRAEDFIRSPDKGVEAALVFFAKLREIWTN